MTLPSPSISTIAFIFPLNDNDLSIPQPARLALNDWTASCPFQLLNLEICLLNFASGVELWNLATLKFSWSVVFCIGSTKSFLFSFREKTNMSHLPIIWVFHAQKFFWLLSSNHVQCVLNMCLAVSQHRVAEFCPTIWKSPMMQTGTLTSECAVVGCQINSKLKKESNQQQIKWLLKAHGVNIHYSQVVIAIEIDCNVIRKMKWEASQLPSSVRHRPQGTTKYSVNFSGLLGPTWSEATYRLAK